MSKILICSREEGMRESLRFILEDSFELIVTDDIISCLQYMNPSLRGNLLFLDVNLDFKIIDKIKGYYPDIQIIAMGGYQSTGNAEEMVRRGALGYIIKPFRSQEILALVRKYIK